MKLWPGWLVVLAGACGSGTAGSPPTTANQNVLETNATVVRVVDGDTVQVDFGDVDVGNTSTHVRLIGIDTPETKKPNAPIECWGPEASAFTAEVLPEGTAVLLVRDLEARDDYGRLLAYVYRSRDGLFVNLEIVAEGYARPLTFHPNDAHAAEFVAAARSAEADDLGLWGACSG